MQLTLLDLDRPPPAPIRYLLPKRGQEVKEVTVADHSQCPLFEPVKKVLTHVGVDSAEAATWSEIEVRQLHRFLLERSLALLAESTTSPSDVAGICSWIFDGGHIAAKLVRSDGAVRYLYWEEVPFSYECCCKLAGYDSDELRDLIRAQLADLPRPVVIDYI